MTRSEVERYADQLIGAKYATSSINTYLAAAKALCLACGAEWPADRMHLGLPAAESGGPVVQYGLLGSVIMGLKAGPALPRALVALSSIYGLRAGELQSVLAAGHTGNELVIQTEKRGRKRVHRIPDMLVSTLTFRPTQLTRDQINRWYARVLRIVHAKPAPRESWHAVRRGLVTGLLSNEAAEADVARWMGWKATNIMRVYYQPDTFELDKRIYERHPFLGYWRL